MCLTGLGPWRVPGRSGRLTAGLGVRAGPQELSFGLDRTVHPSLLPASLEWRLPRGTAQGPAARGCGEAGRQYGCPWTDPALFPGTWPRAHVSLRPWPRRPCWTRCQPAWLLEDGLVVARGVGRGQASRPHSVLSWLQGRQPWRRPRRWRPGRAEPWGPRPWAEPAGTGEVGPSPSLWPVLLSEALGAGGPGPAWTPGAGRGSFVSAGLRSGPADLVLWCLPLGWTLCTSSGGSWALVPEAARRGSPPPRQAPAGRQPGVGLPNPT